MSDVGAENDWHTAIHEAGHCVVGYLHGWTLVPELGIRIGGTGYEMQEGICHMRSPAHDRTSYRAVQQALAGRAAEMILAPDRVKPWGPEDLLYSLDVARWGGAYEDEASDDSAVAFSLLLEWMPSADDAKLIETYEACAAEVLSLLRSPENWGAVQRLAKAVLEERHIRDPERVAQLIAG